MQAGNFRVAVAVAASVLAPASGQTPEQQAEAMLSKMSLEEKVTLLSGHTTNYTGGVPEIVNATSGVRIPPLNLNDGPQGYRSGGTTCWPSALTVGATFDVELAGQWGQAMGKEFYDKGANVQLGPGVCLARVPVNGRNFECESPEARQPPRFEQCGAPVIQRGCTTVYIDLSEWGGKFRAPGGGSGLTRRSVHGCCRH